MLRRYRISAHVSRSEIHLIVSPDSVTLGDAFPSRRHHDVRGETRTHQGVAVYEEPGFPGNRFSLDLTRAAPHLRRTNAVGVGARRPVGERVWTSRSRSNGFGRTTNERRWTRAAQRAIPSSNSPFGSKRRWRPEASSSQTR